jgi:hypothetical protein
MHLPAAPLEKLAEKEKEKKNKSHKVVQGC